jgi:hypothetical protein
MNNILILPSLRQSILIWLATNGIATFSYLSLTLAGFKFEPFICFECTGTLGFILLIGLAVSSPVNLFLTPLLYILNSIAGRSKKIVGGVTIILFLCVAVIIFFLQLFHISGPERFDIVFFLLPYVVGALVSFMLISKKTSHKPTVQ